MKIKPPAKKSRRRREEEEDASFGERRSLEKPLRETEKHAEEERAKDATRVAPLGAVAGGDRVGADARRLPPKTPIRDFAEDEIHVL